MIGWVIEWSARHRLVVVLVTLALAAMGARSLWHVPLDALPDLSDTQVIVYSRWDRSPDLVEDQVTYPLVTAMVGGPRVRAVRGFSDFGYSYVYVIFEDGTDLYWARSRVLEYLAGVHLPAGVQTELGPDATGLGWVFQYALVDDSGRHDLAELRSLQDWYLKYHLKSVPGVAEVAPLGGFGRQYQVNVDPNRLLAFGVTVEQVAAAVRGGNSEVGGRLIELGGTEYMIRGRGYARSARDLEEIVVTGAGTAPVRVKDVAQVVLGPDLRRGVAELDGRGEVVSGIVIVRQGVNTLDVLDRVKAKLAAIAPGLPPGVRVVPIYDRSDLVRRAIANLRTTLLEVILTVALVILVFLWHPPSAIVPMVTIPVTVLIAFLPFGWMHLTANIMSLGGIAIAVGALVDAAIVVVEQTHKKLEEARASGQPYDERAVIVAAIREVGGPSFFALLVIGASFLPVLALEAEEGRLFTPLAVTKTLCMVVAAVLAVTFDPALRLLVTRMRGRFGAIHSEERHPLSRALIRLYAPVVRWSLRHRQAVIAAAVAVVIAALPLFARLGSEFMPPLDEGALLYMPSTLPGISIAEARRLLQATDTVLKRFPEVDHVLGKAGRAETPTDPAPLSMLETVITLRPRSEWPRRRSTEALVAEMNEALRVPGVSNAWTMPIKGRIDMLTTGLRTPVGLKISGPNPAAIDALGARIEKLLATVPGTRSVFSERIGAGYFIDLDWNREALGREGVSLDEAQAAVAQAIGGEDVTTTVEGRERYPVNVRYLRDYRSDLDALGRVLVSVAGGRRQVPLGQLARVRVSTGPSMLRDEDGLLTGYVYVDVADGDAAGYVERGERVLRAQLHADGGCAYVWSGQYEAIARVRARLAVIVPLTLLLILILLYANTGSLARTLIVLLAVPFSAVGAVALVWALGYHLSVAVWVGLIALLGVDAETGMFMLLYLDLSYERARREGRLTSLEDLRAAIVAGAAKRIRPKVMTAATMFLGLVPIMWATGTGADVMKRIAAPMIGGIFTSFLLELVVYPAIYETWKVRASASAARDIP